jgi:hypothetical protein
LLTDASQKSRCFEDAWMIDYGQESDYGQKFLGNKSSGINTWLAMTYTLANIYIFS